MARTAQPFDISLGLEGTHVLITGGCGLIGRVVVEAFLAAGANVSVLDLPEALAKRQYYGARHNSILFVPVDITQAESVNNAFVKAEDDFGAVECCVALASMDLCSLQQTESICDMDPKMWQTVFNVNINGTFLTAQRWLRGIRSALTDPIAASNLHNVNLIIMGSESGKFGARTMAAYSAGKAAVQYGLLQSLAKDAPRIYLKARVNGVAPGAVDTSRSREEIAEFGPQWEYEEYQARVPLAKPVPMEHVARSVLFLASETWSGTTHGQLLHVNGGKCESVVWQPGEAQMRRPSEEA
ncbi:hypothetical protein CERZMDRAFT_107459 [Cercospora zeae-maydis SCOH1-5]|uniref:Ketoreductase (KR) domain-containing protein n=1 Tax=Cercospora zeae-maydis SCOH1-5 TaxID=717836 RepID=A0A6A6F627_9PEZI|nr:hypothetical protein CERZMDRAFT_107459 [Cercospora zeae-maydis SCOH1-5]